MNRIKRIRNILVTAYVFLIMIIHPLYMKNGFVHLATAKQTFFYYTSALCLLPAFVLHLITIFQTKPALTRTSCKNLFLSPDGFVLGYFIVLVISSCASQFSQTALLGADTWFMGLFSQGLFCLSYFLISRCFRVSEKWLYGMFISSSIVFLLCVLNRFYLDPLKIYTGRNAYFWNAFISTLGQKNWFACYLAIALPVECGTFLVKTEKRSTICLTPALCIGFAAMVLQDSDSIYIGMLFTLLFLFMVFCGTLHQLQRFFELLIIASGTLILVGFAQIIWKPHMVSLSAMPFNICQSWILRILFAVFLIIRLMLGLYIRKADTQKLSDTEKWIKRLKLIVGGLAAITIFVLITLIVLVTNFRGAINFGSLADSKYFYFNNAWGTYRGVNWIYSVNVLKEFSPFQILFGIGPDCFQAYALLYHPDFCSIWTSPVCNSHNELLTALINVGILGAVCYYGTFLTSIHSIKKSRKQHPIALALAAGVIGCMFNNFFSFMNGISTPLLFIILGFLQNLVLQKTSNKQ